MHEAITFGFKDRHGNVSKENLRLIERDHEKFGIKLKKVSCKVLHALIDDLAVPRHNLFGQRLGLRKRQIEARKKGRFQFGQTR